MTSKQRILSALRKKQATFPKHELESYRKVVNLEDTSLDGLISRFVQEADALSCQVYHADDVEDAIDTMLTIIGDQKSVLAWDDATLPFPIADILAQYDITIKLPDDTQTQIGITGVDGALAGTGSLIVQSKAGQVRSVSLLPDHHIALVKSEQLVPDFETWVAQQRDKGFDAFKDSSNTVIISGPSKTADIAQELIKGAHGPRKVHIILLG
ncbi:MAG: lactate utilization protein [Chloroflexota bacterium]